MKKYNRILEIINGNEFFKMVVESSPICIGMKQIDQPIAHYCTVIEFEFTGSYTDMEILRELDFSGGMDVVEFVETMFHGKTLIDTDDPILELYKDVSEQFKLIPTRQADFLYLSRLLKQVIQTRLSATSETLQISRINFKTL